MLNITKARRRDTLVELSDLLNNEDSLKEAVGKNCLLDMSLALYAQHDEQLMQTLEKYLNVDELLQDIQHIANSAKLRRRGIDK